MKTFRSFNLILTGILFALGLILPFLTGQIPRIGNMLLPMHLPVFLAGFVLGGPRGMVLGLLLPPIRYLLFQAPPLYPTAIAMSYELASYGVISGYLFQSFPKKNVYIYFNILITMFVGRIVWALVSLLLYYFSGSKFTWQMFVFYGFANAVPGIILQFLLLPKAVMVLRKMGFMDR